MTQGYAYEIRFVDDDKVQVFDLARRHLDPTSATLPTEYKEEEVLRGDLRYSKLLGTQQPVTDDQWEHVTYTKRGRRSIQRHTFMMGSSSTEHDTVMDLEVGNKDITDSRFNNDNIYNNNSIYRNSSDDINNNNSRSIAITDGNSESIASQSTSFEQSISEPIENLSDHKQSIHFESIEEADMTTLAKKSTFSSKQVERKKMIENQNMKTQRISSQFLRSSSSSFTSTDDPHLESNKQADDPITRQNQYQFKESDDHTHLSLNQQDSHVNPISRSNDREHSIDPQSALDTRFDSKKSPQNSFENKSNSEFTQNTLEYKHDFPTNRNDVSSNSKNPLYYHQDNNRDNSHHQDKVNHQAQLGFSNMAKTNDYSQYTPNNINTTTITIPTTAVTSREKHSYYSTSMSMSNDNTGNETLTRVKSVPLENYDASPERSCCIIS